MPTASGVLPYPYNDSQDTAAAGGTATTPAAGAAIATIASGSLPAGIYEVRVTLVMSGTAETKPANAQIQKGATVLTLIPSPGSGVIPATVLRRVTLDGATALTVNAATTATTGAIYTATIAATRVAS